MTEPMSCRVVRGCSPAVYCGNCDLLVGLDVLHVLTVVAAVDHLRVRVESSPGLMGARPAVSWPSATAGVRSSSSTSRASDGR